MKDKVAGKAQEVKGKLTGDKSEALKGKARQKVGGVEQVGKEMAYDAEHGSKTPAGGGHTERRRQPRRVDGS